MWWVQYISTYAYVVKNNKIGTQLQDYLLNGQHSLGHLVCNLFPSGMRKQFVQKKHSFDKKKIELNFSTNMSSQLRFSAYTAATHIIYAAFICKHSKIYF